MLPILARFAKIPPVLDRPDDDGPMLDERAVTIAEWADLNGFDRSTGTYSGEKRPGSILSATL